MAIINDNDMEIILKGSQEQVIRKMLNDRLFCVVKLPVKKPDKLTGKYSSSVFVSNMNAYCFRSFAIRRTGSKNLYEDCESYLCVNHGRGLDEEKKGYFERSFKRIISNGGSIINLTVDELINSLKGKELVLITSYMHYGNFEHLKVEDFLEKLLFLRSEAGSGFLRRDEACDIRVYLRRIENERPYSEYGFSLEDVRDLDIRHRLIELLEKRSKRYFLDDNYYSAEYESRTEDIQAAYFVSRFHSNHQWDADPVNIVNVRIAAFVLPGEVSRRDAKKLPMSRKTKKHTTGADFMIDSIHFNSDIFTDIDEFEEFIDSYFLYFSYD